MRPVMADMRASLGPLPCKVWRGVVLSDIAAACVRLEHLEEWALAGRWLSCLAGEPCKL